MPVRYIIAFILWVAWMLPFLRKAAEPRKKAVVKDVSARWGMAIQGVAFGFVYGIPDFEVPFWRAGIGVLFGATAILTSHFAIRHLDQHWRFDAALSDDHRLVSTGPYAIVRHPIYAAMFAMLLSAGLLLARWWALAAAMVVYIIGTEIRVRSEDRLLGSRFGEQFEMYRRRVAAYVPFVR